MAPSHEITGLLIRWSEGDPDALDELVPLVYDELRRLAANYIRRERPGQTLQPTALVHEAYLRLVDQQNLEWHGREEFFALAAKVMRNLLVDRARRRAAYKRGGDAYKVSISDVDIAIRQSNLELIMLDDILDRLAAIKPQYCRIVEMRVFAGLTIPETAKALGVSDTTVERDWRFARAWLHRELSA
jgi:RNA polymerase sigma factor (TIGR02999 family)